MLQKNYTARPFSWLYAGCRDFSATLGPSLAHGALLVSLGWIFSLVGGTHVHFIAAVTSGPRVVGPVFIAAFYELSRLREQGRPETFDASLDGAMRNGRPLVYLGLMVSGAVCAGAINSPPRRAICSGTGSYC